MMELEKVFYELIRDLKSPKSDLRPAFRGKWILLQAGIIACNKISRQE
jgi:hypothetical protein